MKVLRFLRRLNMENIPFKKKINNSTVISEELFEIDEYKKEINVFSH